MLARLQEAADAWVAGGKQAHSRSEAKEDYRFATRDGREVMYRVDYLHDKGRPASLELLGSPEVLGIAESLAGHNMVPTYEAMVFKDRGNGAAVRWHQDATHPRRHRIFNVDIYLDAAWPGQGALRVVSGSQVSKVDVCEIEAKYGWEVPGSLEVRMGPGDVLVHDVMLVHGSEPTVGNALRRTIYYEFRPAEQILEEGPGTARGSTSACVCCLWRSRPMRRPTPAVPGLCGERIPPFVLSGSKLSCGCHMSCTARVLTRSAGDVPVQPG